MGFYDDLDPLVSFSRKGTSESPYADMDESLIVDNGGKVQLTEFPNQYARVSVEGDNKTWYETTNEIPTENEYVVDYQHKMVTFHQNNAGKQLRFLYSGMGGSHISVKNIYTQVNDGVVTETLKDLTDNTSQAATDANNAAVYANTQGDYAKAEGEKVESFVDETEYKEPYDNTKTYQKNNVVTFNGASFMAKQETTGNAPPDPSVSEQNTYWGLLSRKGADGNGTVATHEDSFIATEGQTIFDLSSTYDQFQERTWVYVGGVLQKYPENYEETTSTRITLSEGVPSGTEVIIKYFGESVPLESDIQTTVNNHTESLSNHAIRLNDNEQLLSEHTSQLAEKATKEEVEVKADKMALNHLRKIETEKRSQVMKKDDFTNELDKWEFTDGIAIDTNMLTISSSVGNHLNVALFKEVRNARGIEVTLGSGGDPSKVRVAFGADTKNFVFINNNGSASTMDAYRVEGGVLNTSPISKSPGFDVVAGDRIKGVLHGQNLQVFKNDVLLATFEVRLDKQYLIPHNQPIMAGVAWRDNTTSKYYVDEVKVYPKVIEKYMHISIDDFIGTMKALTNSTSYTSIFDNAIMNYLKQMHDKYGAVFTLNLLYSYVNSSSEYWDLTSMTDRFKDEFRDNSDWLKFTFHGEKDISNYGNGSITTTEALTHYNNIMAEIRRFAHPYNIDTVMRSSMFSGSLDIARAWRDATPIGARGFLTADDERSSDMYLNSTQRTTMRLCDDYYDPIEKLYFVTSMYRLDGNTDVMTFLNDKVNDITFAGRQNIRAMFLHEGSLSNDTGKKAVEDCCKWAINNGYIFEFPMNYIPEC